MKSVLISIQPKWCELIVNGKKTIEVRKTKPKLETLFKVYIYCTYGQGLIEKNDLCYSNMLLDQKVSKNAIWGNCCNGKVIGEFVCERIEEYYADDYAYGTYDISDDEVIKTCLVNGSLWDYGKGQILYGWHISNLVIYDKPKELGEFSNGSSRLEFSNTEDGFPLKWSGMKRPPQSWCYVESEVAAE